MKTSLRLVLLLLAACEGQISAIGAGRGGGGPVDPGQTMREHTDPTLEELAQKYFPGDDATPPSRRLFRLTRAQLDATTRALLPAQFGESISATMPRDPLRTNYEYATDLGFSDASFTPYVSWVAALATRVKASPASVVSCAADATACQQTAAKAFVQRAFRGAAAPAQLQRYADLFTSSVTSVGLPQATADLVDVTLAAPAYVFRDEVSTDATGALLSPLALQNLTYTLADAPPQALGLDPAMPAADALERVLASTQAREKLMRFFVAWLELREADELTLSPAVFPEFTPAFAAAARAETLAFLQAALSKSTPTLKDITQAVPANAPDAHRLGVFTTAATIASHSGPTTTRLVKRGVFFTRKVMCMDLGNPPPDANTTLPTDGGATERERVETATTPARCQGCHAYINPFGFMQENYDALGRWRTTDEGVPIDAHVKIPWLDEGPLETSSPTEAFKAITSSARFKQCFVKQLFRFYLGRDEQPGDAALMRDMFFWFAHDDEQDLLKLLRTLSTSPRFSTRT